MKRSPVMILGGVLVVIVIAAAGYFLWQRSSTLLPGTDQSLRSQKKFTFSLQEIDLNSEKIVWMPVEFQDKPYLFQGETYAVNATVYGIDSDVTFVVFLGGKNGETSSGVCHFDADKKQFLGNNRFFIEKTSELAGKISSGTKAQIRFGFPNPPSANSQELTSLVKDTLTKLVTAVNNNNASEQLTVVPNQICIAE